jgi:CDK-activating kinase assembly factor MAT1
MKAGGYRVEEAWERAIRYAVAGLDLLPLQGLHAVIGSVVQSGTSDADVVMAAA